MFFFNRATLFNRPRYPKQNSFFVMKLLLEGKNKLPRSDSKLLMTVSCWVNFTPLYHSLLEINLFISCKNDQTVDLKQTC